MKKLLKNKTLVVSLVLLFIISIYSIDMGINSVGQATFQFVMMLKIVPPIFLLIGLLDVWVPRETMIRIMGEKSGPIGVLIAFSFGTFAAGPLVAAFPVAVIMLKKGARYANVLFFLTIWASAKLPILFFQANTLGVEFTIYSNITLIIVYLFGSYLIERMLGKKYIEKMIENFEKE